MSGIPGTTEYSSRSASFTSFLQNSIDLDNEIRSLIDVWGKPVHSLSLSCKEDTPTKSKADERVCQVFQEVFGEKSLFSPFLKTKIGDYIPEETTFFAHRTFPFRHLFIQPFAPFVDLSDPETLKCYLANNCQTQKHLVSAAKMVKSIYEAAPRYLVDEVRFGSAFAMNPEVMAYAMELLKKDCHEQTGKIALEIGAASGENSIILAFSDVEKVYANEINSKEIQQFGTLKSDLPQGVKKKLESIEGSCFDLLKINPELKNTIDLILCRNVIHFFTLKEHVEFFKLIHSLLKPGGRGIFTVNSTYAYLEHNSAKKCFKKNPDQACFRDLSCFIYDNRVSNMPSKCIYNQISPWPQEAFSLDVVKNFIFRRSKETNFKWKVYNENLAQLDSAVQSKIISAYKKHKKKIQVIKHGSVQISITNTNIYNEQTLTRLFRNRGLEIESLFHVNRLGHLVDQREAPMKGYQIGIVCKKPVS